MGGTKEKRKRFLASSFGIFGSPSWARTSDLRINSPSLYRLSYRGVLGNVVGTFPPNCAWLPELGSNQRPAD